MKDEKNYLSELIDNSQYFKKLTETYNKLVSVETSRHKLNEIDKTATEYAGTEQNSFIPNYVCFYEYACDYCSLCQSPSTAHPTYKDLLGESRKGEIPEFYYFLILFAHLVETEREFIKKPAYDAENLSRKQIRDSLILLSKVKLLAGFLEKVNPLLASVIDAMNDENIEYLDDDIKQLDSHAIKHRFMMALQNKDKTMAFKLLGRMRELDEGEDYYFEALAHYINNQYEDSIRYIGKIKKTDIDYPSAIALELECYSLLGDFKSFGNCVRNNAKLEFEDLNFTYLLMSLILHVSPDKFANNEIDFGSFENVHFVNGKNQQYYDGLIRRLVSNILVEGIQIIEDALCLDEMVEDFEIPAEKYARLVALQNSIGLVSDEFRKFITLEYVEKEGLGETKRKVEETIVCFLVHGNPRKSFENYKVAFLAQLQLGDSISFIENVVSNFEILKECAINGENDAEELLNLAYVESSISGTVDAKLKKYIEEDCQLDLAKDVADKKIVRILSPRGKIAYESAEWQFQKSQECDYGWRDAGMISLGFYRILEVELNQKLIIPLLSNIGYEKINSEFARTSDKLSGEEKRKYKTKWSMVLKTYKEMSETNYKDGGFMLGVLDHFLRNIGSEYDMADGLATLVRKQLPIVLNSYGLEKFEDGFFEEMTKNEIRNKFRNPPAHTKYLPYETACECREMFRKSILQIGDMLKIH